MNNLPIPVNEAFATLQGEAHHTGRPSVFIRLQGCDVGCPWCDTKYTWHNDQRNLNATTLFDLGAADGTWNYFTAGGIADAIKQRYASIKHVVITGGEPCTYDLTELTTALVITGHSVQVETSGTYPIRVHKDTWVTLSPKIDMPGRKVVMKDSILRANEIKYPVGRVEDIDKLHALLAGYGLMPARVDIWLQPLSRSPKATSVCVDLAMQYGYRLSLQTHHFLNLR